MDEQIDIQKTMVIGKQPSAPKQEAPEPVAQQTTHGNAQTVRTNAQRNDQGRMRTIGSTERTGSKMHGAQSGEQCSSFILKGKEYDADTTISESTGEAQVVLVEREGQKYILKLYYPNFHFNEDIMRAVWNMDIEFVMKVYDYGKTIVNGTERDYELMEYLRGGTLSQYGLGEDLRKFRHIALQGAAALACLHNWGIIHKDIKPGNFFFRDADATQLVVGDFGISSIILPDKEFVRTSQARTPAFAAPEMYEDVIDGEVEIDQRADFYSLGITLLYLWLGHNPFGKNERLMMRMKQEGRLPHVNELPETVSTIIRGLTSLNPMKRWGYEEVVRWFKGEEVAVDMSSAYLRYKTFILDAERNLSAHDLKELVPLMHANQDVSRSFLYSKRISQWLDECGNAKMSVVLNDIVDNRYPHNQQAGLAAAIYALEPNFPYYDIHGHACDNLSDTATSLLQYADEYSVVLQDSFNPLFSYIESHSDHDIARLRGYFKDNVSRTSVLKLAYEIDPSIPFLSHEPSDTMEEVLAAFAKPRTQDEWHSIIDGRLLAWLYGRGQLVLCELVRHCMEQTDLDEHTRAWCVFYNVDRSCAYDLKDITTEMQVGRMLEDILLKNQQVDEETFAKSLYDFTSKTGRLYNYALLRGWSRVISFIEQFFDMDAPINTDRMQLYDLRTAAYKFCVALGGAPPYRIHNDSYGTEIRTIDELSEQPPKAVRDELRHGSLKQWISVFYHENPLESFEEPYSYERSLESFLQMIGGWDNGEMHFKRFVKAEDEMQKKIDESRSTWRKSILRQRECKFFITAISALWILLLLFVGFHVTEDFQRHAVYYTVLPVAPALITMFVVRSYFRGHGFLVNIVWALLAISLSFIPAFMIKLMSISHPGMLRWMVLGMSSIYIYFALRECLQRPTNLTGQNIDQVFEVDENKILLEKLYYTFKARSFKFKASNFGAMDDLAGESNAARYEVELKCIIWSILLCVLVLIFVIYHPSLLNRATPDIEALKLNFFSVWAQIKQL